jgi:DNA-binding HxlR family transcriptional regulator
MVKRKSMKDDPCPVARSLDIVGDHWSLLIVRDAFDGVRRFSDFQRTLGVARNILADRLRGLVEEEVFTVRPVSEGASHQEYVLTPKGEQLFPVIVALRQWGERNLFERGEKYSRMLDNATGKAIGFMEPVGSNGQVLNSQNTSIKKI